MSCIPPRTFVLVVLALLLASGTAFAQEGMTFQVTAAPHERPASVTGDDAVVPRYTDVTGDSFMVPFFKVDRSSASGETTLIAIRNSSSEAHDVNIVYFVDHPYAPGASPDVTQSFTLLADEVGTFNLRDLPGITGGAGGDAVIRGWLMAEHAEGVGNALSADWFRVNPSQDFATGGRMVDTAHSYTCTRWDFRYISGGAFTGGTRLEVFIDTPLGGAEPSFSIDFFDEPGGFLGGVQVFINRQVAELDVAALLGELPGSPSSFGSMVITFEPGTNGGLVTGTYRAEGRYSVGLNGTCIVP